MINLKVELGRKTYPIFIGDNMLANLGEMMQLYGFATRAVVITDANVAHLYGDAITASLSGRIELLEVISLPAGEKSKSFPTLERIMTDMLRKECDRAVAVLAFGGGVVGDIAGFAASVYKRGVPYIQIPTTLLAQVDSSVGGKTGINHALGKNLVGTFYQPKMVWSDLALLESLPPREIRCGLGEIIKYGIIKDADLFAVVEAHLERILELDPGLLQEIVKRCCEIKASVVAADERESGLRMILNFGHTVGHAIEAALGYKSISHGEAVLAGMLAESKMALCAALLDQTDFDRIAALLSRFGLLRKLGRLSRSEILRFMKSDKKAMAGKLRFVLPRTIGKVDILDEVEETLIEHGLDVLNLR